MTGYNPTRVFETAAAMPQTGHNNGWAPAELSVAELDCVDTALIGDCCTEALGRRLLGERYDAIAAYAQQMDEWASKGYRCECGCGCRRRCGPTSSYCRSCAAGCCGE